MRRLNTICTKSGGKFGETVLRIMNDTPPMSEEEKVRLLEYFEGEEVTVQGGGTYYNNYANRHEGLGTVRVSDSGIILRVENDHYREIILGVDEDNQWAYDRAMDNYGGYYDNCEELEKAEVDYTTGNWSTDTLTKWNEVMREAGELDYIKNDRGQFNEGDVSNPMEKLFYDTWDDVADEIVHTLGCGIGEYRANEVREIIESETLFESSFDNNYASIHLSWVQLLWLIKFDNAKTFTDIIHDEWNTIDDSLHDSWYDSYGYSDDVGDEIDNLMNKFLTDLIEKDIKNLKTNYEKAHREIERLGFILDNSMWRSDTQGINSGNYMWLDEKNKKQINLHSYSPTDDKVLYTVYQHIDGEDYTTNRQTTDTSGLSDLVIDELNPNVDTKVTGRYGIKYNK